MGYYCDDRGGCLEGLLMAAVLLVFVLLALRLLLGLVPPGFW